MAAQQLFAKIETPISVPGSAVAESMLNKISRFRSSIDQIKEDNLDLERMRDQYIIHLQQCQEDHEILRTLYKSLKQKLDRAASALVSNGAGQNPQDEQQNASANADRQLMAQSQTSHVIPENITPTFSEAKRKVALKAAFSVQGIICSVAYNKQGTQVAFSTGVTLFVLDAETGQTQVQIDLPSTTEPDKAHCRSIIFIPDENKIAMTGYPNQIYVINLTDKSIQATLLGHTTEANSLIYNTENKCLISGGFDGNIILWSMKDFKEIKRIPMISQGAENAIVGIAASPDTSFYAIAAADGNVSVFSSDFAPGTTFEAHKNSMMGIAVSPNDETIATVSQDNTIKIWTLRVIASKKFTLEGHTDYTLTAAFSNNSHILVTGSKDQTIRLWNYKKGEQLNVISAHKNTVFAIAHHPGKDQFVSVGGDSMICFWDYTDKDN